MTRVQYIRCHTQERSINNSRGFYYPHKKLDKAGVPTLHFVTMPLCAAPLLLVIFNIHSTQANLKLQVSRPQHEGPLSIKGQNETCRSVLEGANRCYLTENCRGIIFYKSGAEKRCQTATCLPGRVVGSVNQVPGEAKLLLRFDGTFTTGDGMLFVVPAFKSLVLW